MSCICIWILDAVIANCYMLAYTFRLLKHHIVWKAIMTITNQKVIRRAQTKHNMPHLAMLMKMKNNLWIRPEDGFTPKSNGFFIGPWYTPTPGFIGLWYTPTPDTLLHQIHPYTRLHWPAIHSYTRLHGPVIHPYTRYTPTPGFMEISLVDFV